MHLVEDGDDDLTEEVNETEDEQEQYEASNNDPDETPGEDDDPGETTGVGGVDNTGVPTLETVPDEDSDDEEDVTAERMTGMGHGTILTTYGHENHGITAISIISAVERLWV